MKAWYCDTISDSSFHIELSEAHLDPSALICLEDGWNSLFFWEETQILSVVVEL